MGKTCTIHQIISAFLYLFFPCFLLISCLNITYDIVIPKETIQQSLNKKFPIKKTFAGTAQITLSDPALLAGESEKRFTIGVSAIISPFHFGFANSKGHIVFSSNFEFKNSSGEFLLHDIKVDSIDLGKTDHSVNKEVTEAISTLLQNTFEGFSFYQLNPKNASTSVARRFISGVKIRKDAILVTLSSKKGFGNK
jgi:hypothetical protein